MTSGVINGEVGHAEYGHNKRFVKNNRITMLLIHTVIKEVVNSAFGCYYDKFSNLDCMQNKRRNVISNVPQSLYLV